MDGFPLTCKEKPTLRGFLCATGAERDGRATLTPIHSADVHSVDVAGYIGLMTAPRLPRLP